MCKFYSYKGNAPLGKEKLGTEGRSLDELKTVKGVKNRLLKAGWVEFKIYSYTNFYNDSTFRLVHRQTSHS